VKADCFFACLFGIARLCAEVLSVVYEHPESTRATPTAATPAKGSSASPTVGARVLRPSLQSPPPASSGARKTPPVLQRYDSKLKDGFDKSGENCGLTVDDS
jgi:hypothetical protein